MHTTLSPLISEKVSLLVPQFIPVGCCKELTDFVHHGAVCSIRAIIMNAASYTTVPEAWPFRIIGRDVVYFWLTSDFGLEWVL